MQVLLNEVLDMFVHICLFLKHIHDLKPCIDYQRAEHLSCEKQDDQLGDFEISRVLYNSIDKDSCQDTSRLRLTRKPIQFKIDIWPLDVVCMRCVLRSLL